MGLCASSSTDAPGSGPGAARTVLVSPRARPRDQGNETDRDRYCRCNPDVVAQSKSFVCPVCHKIRLNLKKSAKQAIGNGRGAGPPETGAHRRNDAPRRRSHRSIERSQRRKEIEEDRAYRKAYRDHAGDDPSGRRESLALDRNRLDENDPEGIARRYASDYDRLMKAAHLNPQNGTDSDYDSLTSNASSIDSDSFRPARQLSSSKFKVVSHKVQNLVELSKFYEMALRKLFRDFDIDKNGFIDAPELCQLIANATGRAGVYQPLTLQEAEAFLTSSNRHGDRVIGREGSSNT